jgi:hypothetical protein
MIPRVIGIPAIIGWRIWGFNPLCLVDVLNHAWYGVSAVEVLIQDFVVATFCYQALHYSHVLCIYFGVYLFYRVHLISHL